MMRGAWGGLIRLSLLVHGVLPLSLHTTSHMQHSVFLMSRSPAEDRLMEDYEDELTKYALGLRSSEPTHIEHIILDHQRSSVFGDASQAEKSALWLPTKKEQTTNHRSKASDEVVKARETADLAIEKANRALDEVNLAISDAEQVKRDTKLIIDRRKVKHADEQSLLQTGHSSVASLFAHARNNPDAADLGLPNPDPPIWLMDLFEGGKSKVDEQTNIQLQDDTPRPPNFSEGEGNDVLPNKHQHIQPFSFEDFDRPDRSGEGDEDPSLVEGIVAPVIPTHESNGEGNEEEYEASAQTIRAAAQMPGSHDSEDEGVPLHGEPGDPHAEVGGEANTAAQQHHHRHHHHHH